MKVIVKRMAGRRGNDTPESTLVETYGYPANRKGRGTGISKTTAEVFGKFVDQNGDVWDICEDDRYIDVRLFKAETMRNIKTRRKTTIRARQYRQSRTLSFGVITSGEDVLQASQAPEASSV